MTPQDDFRRQRKALMSSCQWGSMYFRLYIKVVTNKDKVNQRAGRHFFIAVDSALTEAGILVFNKLTDKRRGVLSIEHFLNFVAAHPGIFLYAGDASIPLTVEKDRAMLEARKTTFDNAKRLRDRWIAHTALDALATEPPKLNVNALLRGFGDAADIVNRYSLMFDNSQSSLVFVGEDDVDGVFRLLEKALGLDVSVTLREANHPRPRDTDSSPSAQNDMP